MLRRRAANLLLPLLLLACSIALANVQYDSIHSKRGVQHKPPLISDDFIVSCIMVMFLLLFCFGKQ